MVSDGHSQAVKTGRSPHAAGELTGELLYNGIRLPAVWPPRNMVPGSREPMPVPYLDAPPAVIRIDVGRQLFVDGFLIEDSTLERTFHKPQPWSGNPLLTPEKPWEQETNKDWRSTRRSAAASFDDGVFYDPADKLFKLFYAAGQCNHTALAYSDDGLHWRRPEFDVVKGTNIVIPKADDFTRDSFSPLLDLETRDPQQRFKAYIYNRMGHTSSLLTSPDGIHWKTLAPLTYPTGDGTAIFYNPFRKVWVCAVKRVTPTPPHVFSPGDGHEIKYYSESRDFRGLADAEPVFWFHTDRLDKRFLADGTIDSATQSSIYAMRATPYESIMLANIALFAHYLEAPKATSWYTAGKNTQWWLGYSRDGFHWARPDREPFVTGSFRDDAWDRSYVRPTGGSPLVVGDKLYFYYSAWKNKTPEGKAHKYAGGSMHVALLRRDGFVSMDAGEKEGTLTTRPVAFTGKCMFVNADCPHGELRVEVLDKDGEVIEPFTKAACKPVSGDKTLSRVEWQGADDLAAVRDRPVRFRFSLKKGKLYAFWVDV